VLSTGPAALSPYRLVLGPAFDQLHPSVQRAHSAPLVAHGLIDVVHGSHRLTPFLVAAMRLPAKGLAQRTVLTVAERSCRGAVEMLWSREIGGSPLRTVQLARRGHLIERTGAGSIEFRLRVEDGAMIYEQSSMYAVGVQLPMRLCPHVCARVSPHAEGWHVQVSVALRDTLICRYEGGMRPERAAS
jgi:hypothetical protein